MLTVTSVSAAETPQHSFTTMTAIAKTPRRETSSHFANAATNWSTTVLEIFQQKYGSGCACALSARNATDPRGPVRNGVAAVEAQRYSQCPSKEGKYTLNYGMKEKLLAANLGSTVEHALMIKDKYMDRYPAVRAFFDEAVNTARQTGHAYSLLGRRRKLPNIHSHMDYLRYQAERQASNMEIQGTAADVVRMAMLALDDANLEYHFGAEMILQVHDELVFEVPKECAKECDLAIASIMEDPLWHQLPVAMKTSGSIASNWYEAK